MGGNLTFSSLDDVIKHLEVMATDIGSRTNTFRHQLKELTGHNLSEPVTALDVVKIFNKLSKGSGNAVDAGDNASSRVDHTRFSGQGPSDGA